jgi:hypothetical protein
MISFKTFQKAWLDYNYDQINYDAFLKRSRAPATSVVNSTVGYISTLCKWISCQGNPFQVSVFVFCRFSYYWIDFSNTTFSSSLSSLCGYFRQSYELWLWKIEVIESFWIYILVVINRSNLISIHWFRFEIWVQFLKIKFYIMKNIFVHA